MADIFSQLLRWPFTGAETVWLVLFVVGGIAAVHYLEEN